MGLPKLSDMLQYDFWLTVFLKTNFKFWPAKSQIRNFKKFSSLYHKIVQKQYHWKFSFYMTPWWASLLGRQYLKDLKPLNCSQHTCTSVVKVDKYELTSYKYTGCPRKNVPIFQQFPTKQGILFWTPWSWGPKSSHLIFFGGEEGVRLEFFS